ncbi:exendin-3-like [Latimeria chalumnae]|uniref:exendin-3-like n=1 Tax=Latimeria chalumnae TaxID=7897 RepID=UPI0003C13263|nr:PREDICTED: exendin-3-like [Latimeria chalumnae]XP_005986263.1 PREDICTED: exendin-3-like [Latimeria chalumnae]XP_014339618.1 PREDICTED: exendin-3-like [Latimeria chalumnae]|eukprot:XP_005986262.1 PREDICTED: exendin-3-like [Latimeria chalumnae]
MKALRWISLVGLLLLILSPFSWQIMVQDTASWEEYESAHVKNTFSNIKRHSEGTFTSDFTRYLDKMKAKDFVRWLISTKRHSSTKRYMKEGPNAITNPSDLSLFRYDVQFFSKENGQRLQDLP